MSWEPRFILGIKNTIDSNKNVQFILMFYITEYLKWSKSNIDSLKSICAEKKVVIMEVPLSFSTPEQNWSNIQNNIDALESSNSVLLDFTTMPRSILWYILFFLKNKKFKVNYCYYKPGSYNEKWLSRNADKPRLLYKLSGVHELGKPTLLTVFAGYDPERINYLIRHFEPHRTLLILQGTEEFNNKKYRMVYEEKFGGRESFEIIELNTFDIEKTKAYLDDTLLEWKESHNIIITSLGPKTSAISIFNCIQENKEIGLCYVPCKEFNKKYSKDIGEKITGSL